jgi:uncharacterized membrane protein YozB (DUF420 family)
MSLISFFPHLNATLNASSAVLLMSGFVMIKRKRTTAHAGMMISATVVSGLFLICYLIYHYLAGELSTKKMSWLPPALRYTYLAILFTHLVLAVGMVPLIAITLRAAWKRNWALHRKIAPPTFFIWLYVSITGVIIYWMLYHLFESMRPG